MKFGLIGYPLSHSFSKKYFTSKFNQLNVPYSYENIEVNDLSQLFNNKSKINEFSGFNVTIPHKESIINFIHSIHPIAQEIGAVNVIKSVKKESQNFLIGYNTDYIGFYESLLPHLKTNKLYKALILGTGGSSKAIQFALDQLNIKFSMVSTKNNPKEYLQYGDLTKKIIQEHLIIINCTPLGTFPNINNKPPIPFEDITKDHILFDLVYNPEITEFLKEGILKGCTIQNGYEMLTIQAEKSWEIWTSDNI